jgi:hypothetical protein
MIAWGRSSRRGVSLLRPILALFSLLHLRQHFHAAVDMGGEIVLG